MEYAIDGMGTAGENCPTISVATDDPRGALPTGGLPVSEWNITAASALTPLVYPNPWRGDRHVSRGITFSNLSPGSTIRIFTTSGRQAKELTSSGPSVDWDRTNTVGEKVASGVYLFFIKDAAGHTARGKLAIIR